jgi:F0F1-type ATP synthase assembly protein I
MFVRGMREVKTPKGRYLNHAVLLALCQTLSCPKHSKSERLDEQANRTYASQVMPTPVSDKPYASAAGQMIRLSLNLGVAIVIPLLAFLFTGRFLDRQFGTAPMLMLVGIGLAFVITMVLLVAIVRRTSNKQAS